MYFGYNMADRSDNHRSGGSFGNESTHINIQLTDEEKAILKECRTNSLYFRGVPLGLFAAITTRQVVAKGYLPHVKRFSSIYYPAIFGLGLVAGIASYRQKCFEKIMKLENSTLADQVREVYSKAGIPYEKPGRGRSLDYQHHSSAAEGGEHISEGSSSFEMGTSISTSTWQPGLHPSRDVKGGPSQGGGDEISVMPNQFYEEQKGRDAKHATYEELRQKHRSRLQPTFQPEARPSTYGQRTELPDVNKKPQLSDNHKSPQPGKTAFLWEDRLSNQQSQQEGELPLSQKSRGSPPVRKNKYGDVID